MTQADFDPIVKRAVADAVVERASQELHKILTEMVQAVAPFPLLMGLATVQAVEVEPSGVRDPEKGCVVVCPDGELYELILRLIAGPEDVGGIDQVEEMKQLELSDGDYVAYAHAAVGELARIMLEREQ